MILLVYELSKFCSRDSLCLSGKLRVLTDCVKNIPQFLVNRLRNVNRVFLPRLSVFFLFLDNVLLAL